MSYIFFKDQERFESIILLFSCSVSKAVYLELVPKLTTSKFIRCLERLVARRGRPEIKNNVKKFKVETKLTHPEYTGVP